MSNKTKSAMAFILFMGVVSLFADMTHEGARSVYGNYLNLLGASATVIGFVTGLGELLGYSLRYVTGRIADETKNYWTMTIFGYAVNVLAIPCLALIPDTGWVWASILIVAERVGKAIRQPAKNTLLSFAASQNGLGKGFAIQECMDQIGAFLGPVLLYYVVLMKSDTGAIQAYSWGFAALGIPAVCCIACVLLAKRSFPHPETFESVKPKKETMHLQKSFIWYMAAICLTAFGFIDFPLITMHVANNGLLRTEELPLLYAGAMLVDAVAALAFGWMFDTIGMKALMISTLMAAPFAFYVFTATSHEAVYLGVVLWGIGMGAQESTLKSAVSLIVPRGLRSTGFGIFETGFGIAWFAGSFLLGALYDWSLPLMISISVLVQLAAVPVFWYTSRCMKHAV